MAGDVKKRAASESRIWAWGSVALAVAALIFVLALLIYFDTHPGD
jgi:hypothetical protein